MNCMELSLWFSLSLSVGETVCHCKSKGGITPDIGDAGRAQDVRSSGCQDVWGSGCLVVRMSGVLDVRKSGVLDVVQELRKSGCQDVRTTGCLDVWMSGCLNVSILFLSQTLDCSVSGTRPNAVQSQNFASPARDDVKHACLLMSCPPLQPPVSMLK